MIKNLLNYVVTNFGFNDISDFSSSLLHTKLALITIPLAGISSVVQNYFGLQSLTIFSFVLLVSLELITGLTAAKVGKVKIESKKFGRFGLKILVWLSLIFIINSFKVEFYGYKDTFGNMAHGLLSWLHGTLFIYVCFEYLISVLENMAVISGKKNSSFIDLIKDKFKNIFKK